MAKKQPLPFPVFPHWYLKDLVGVLRDRKAQVVLLYGDVRCFLPNPTSRPGEKESYLEFPLFLRKALENGRMVLFYDIASGIQFLRPEMEAVFKQESGFQTPAPAGGDPIALARAELQQEKELPKDPEACLRLMDRVIKNTDKVTIVIRSAHFLAPHVGSQGTQMMNERVIIERLRNWSMDQDIRSRGNLVFLLTDEVAKVTEELRQGNTGVYQIYIPKPTFEERLAFLLTCHHPPAFPKGITLEMLVHATQGLSLRQMQEILDETRRHSDALNLSAIKKAKRKVLVDEYGDLMDIVEPARGLEDIGGLEHIKTFLAEVLHGIASGDHRLVPMGITLTGPPGTGKTAIVEALAYEAGFNFVKTKNIRSMWLGESEARMQKLVYALRDMAPVVVMNDEADLAEAQRDSPHGDSGVSERLMKMWMEFLSDPKIRGQVLVINCTNRPDRMDAALKRSGRSDEIILLPMPSREERDPIFRVMFKRHQVKTDITDLTPFVLATSGMSGADIEQVVLRAHRLASRENDGMVTGEILQNTIGDFIPGDNQQQIDMMTMAGLLACRSRRLLPRCTKEMVEHICARGLVPDMDRMVNQLRAHGLLT
ncbi:MAG: AAA ATPase central domain protein [Candidatus Uhrbacteria bacterium GW2011_GWE2_46_68]|uniref:AAA ATPase central domain protein n=2 Tax=Candidatus Uhriibacteriota TaxID=1752732 RepID=A0A0G1T5N5_9BACT|nr:MAG: AAA ATPase central domain protein [Candidatus Uhrbacteria bacterium GW2011_GWF2_46_218]KKU40725.1 MAG: AAA ATPase central domain protein [Candidatus Uhrbacteria bacterium GW2011_GWE2_46_68]